MTRLTIRRPDDWHLHLRDGAVMRGVLPASASFGRVLVMPNLVPPVVTAADAAAYRARIQAAMPPGQTGPAPHMTLYLTETTEPEDVAAAAASGLISAVKLYPAGATTNSAAGVRDLDRVTGVLERMADIGLPLCVHGEVTDPEIDIFDREAVFLDRVLDPLRRRIPGLRVVLEHVTTADGIAYVRGAERMGATLTVQHLMLTRNDMLVGGIRPHYYCLPILKRAEHRAALRAAAVSGDPRIFFGSDSAPHTTDTKETGCGCAGCFTAPVALACLAQVFEEEAALDRLEGFVALHGAAFYGCPPAETRIVLERGPAWTPPSAVDTGDGPVTVFDPGSPLHWRVVA